MKRMISEPEMALVETLRQLSDKLEKLASRLGTQEADPAPLPPVAAASPIDDGQIVNAVDAIAKRRARKRKYFPAEIVREPAWDMLLELFLAHKKGVRLSTTSLCLVGGVPGSTALRVTGLLESKGLMERYRSSHDKRVTYVRITEKGCAQIEAFITDEVMRRVQQSKNRAFQWDSEIDELDYLVLQVA